jgi:Tetracyclin repressor-like, C-terminal domain
LSDLQIEGSTGHQKIFDITLAIFRAYNLADPDLTDAVRLVRSALHGFVMLESSGGFGDPRDVQHSWSRAVEALHVVLVHWPVSSDS